MISLVFAICSGKRNWEVNVSESGVDSSLKREHTIKQFYDHANEWGQDACRDSPLTIIPANVTYLYMLVIYKYCHIQKSFLLFLPFRLTPVFISLLLTWQSWFQKLYAYIKDIGCQILTTKTSQVPIGLQGRNDGTVSVVGIVGGVDQRLWDGATKEDGIDIVVSFVEGAIQNIGTASGGTRIGRRIVGVHARCIEIRVGFSQVIYVIVVVVDVSRFVLVKHRVDENPRGGKQSALE